MSYKHGIEVAEKATSLKTPLSTEYAAQVIFGTAPVNLADLWKVNRYPLTFQV